MSTEILTQPLPSERDLLIDDTVSSPEVDVPLIDRETAGAKVREEFDKLWGLYAERRAGLTFDFSGQIYEFDVVATRYFHGEDIEEVYSRSRFYRPANKAEHQMKEEVTVNVTTDQGEHEIRVDGGDEVTVLVRGAGDDEWRVAGEHETATHLVEFFHRTMDAAFIHGGRSPEDKRRADASALGLLYARYPEFARPITSTEG